MERQVLARRANGRTRRSRRQLEQEAGGMREARVKGEGKAERAEQSPPLPSSGAEWASISLSATMPCGPCG